MAEITLWGRLSSCNVQKAVWVLEELGLPYRRIDAGGDFGGLDDPAYRAMNPHGKVPTLRDGDQVIWESDAIIRYLAARYGSGALWPADPTERARVDQWQAWASTALYPDWIKLFWMRVRTPEAQQDAEAIEALRARCAERFTVLDRQLAGRPFVAGEALSLADIAAGTTLYRWFEMPIARPETPEVAAWYDRLRARAPFRKAICVPFDELWARLSF
ncbi:glutathione S-transferase family protein [Pelagibius sp.]|uniref:glutathione S-transferase family protein n=1 Tax=Pelagibius sp. TaxID=1931238 RepID=UPI002635CFB3|nr:glutathione S-transferase family protein [Pelagibius sp.]